jgi:hypothetical protein
VCVGAVGPFRGSSEDLRKVHSGKISAMHFRGAIRRGIRGLLRRGDPARHPGSSSAGRSGEASGVFFGGTAARISRAPKFPDAVEPQASNSFGVPGSGRQSFMTSQNPRHQIPLAFLWHLGAWASKTREDASFGRQSFVTLSAFSCQSFLTSRCPSIKVFWHPDPTAPKFLDVFIPGAQVS